MLKSMGSIALLATLVGVAQADGEPPKPATTVVERVDLSAWNAPPTVQGPVLTAPTDLGHSGVGTWATSWSLPAYAERGSPRPTWIEFDGPALETRSFSPQALIEDLSNRTGYDDALSFQAEEDAIVVRGPAVKVAWAVKALGAALLEQAPFVSLRATLLSAGSEPVVRAFARTRLFAGRWTRLWLQEQRPRFTVDYDVEIAQETTVMNPLVAELPDGQECYARWLPGESGSVVEVWTADLQHLEENELDLSVIRNVPEANGCGTLRWPKTAVQRAYTALLFPTQGATAREIAWSGVGGARRLVLVLEEVTPNPAPRARAFEDSQSSMLRVGAQAAGCLFESRPSRVEQVLDELRYPYQDQDMNVSVLAPSGGGLAMVSGPSAVVAGVQQALRSLESGLACPTLGLRVLTVPAETLARALESGALAPGAPVAPTLVERLRQSGAVEGEAVSLPLLTGVKVGFRVGASVCGLTDCDVEVAQQAGATDPICGAMFSGLAGEARVVRHGTGYHLAVDAQISWADPHLGALSLVFRPPVGMQFSRDKVLPESDAVRRVSLPTLGGGSTDMSASLDIPPGDGAERLLGVAVRGSEALLLLVSLRAP